MFIQPQKIRTTYETHPIILVPKNVYPYSLPANTCQICLQYDHETLRKSDECNELMLRKNLYQSVVIKDMQRGGIRRIVEKHLLNKASKN